MPETPAAPWHPLKRGAFRFAFAYFVLINAPFPLDHLPGMSWLEEGLAKGWHVLVAWAGKHVLRLGADVVMMENGSGDTTHDFVSYFCTVALSAVAAAVWSVLDARRPTYDRLHDHLRVYVRYALGATLFAYGMSKVLKTQFPFPGPDRLMEPYGESSPMGLLWTFMGYSTPYNWFTGAAEVGAAALLFFRRTATLGALLAIGVMTNVVMLNFCYDVPVKLYSSHLLVTAMFLALPDARRLLRFFVLNQPTEAVALRRHFEARWMERARWAVKGSFLAWLAFSITQTRLERRAQAEPPLFGIWEVEAFSRNGEALAPSTSDATRWRRLMIGRRGVSVRFMDDSVVRYAVEADVSKKTFSLTAPNDGAKKSLLAFERPDPDHLVLEGPFADATLQVRFKRVDPAQLLLVNRGFHWINEFPLNR